MEARLTHIGVFTLVLVADDYRKGQFGPETLATIHDLLGNLDTITL